MGCQQMRWGEGLIKEISPQGHGEGDMWDRAQAGHRGKGETSCKRYTFIMLIKYQQCWLKSSFTFKNRALIIIVF